MIDRYTLSASANEIQNRFSVDVPNFFKPRYNAAPTQLLPVITSAGQQGLSLFYWGTSPEWSKNKVLAEKIVNVRVESFPEKVALRRSLRKHRCIIPSDGFYCWKRVGKKTSIPYRFTIHNKDLFSFAGMWEEFEDTDGHQIQTFTVITCPASATVKNVYERMPAILTKDLERGWLDEQQSEDQLLKLLEGVSNVKLDFYPVSPSIADPSLDVPSLLLPTPPADQHGNLTLFD